MMQSKRLTNNNGTLSKLLFKLVEQQMNHHITMMSNTVNTSCSNSHQRVFNKPPQRNNFFSKSQYTLKQLEYSKETTHHNKEQLQEAAPLKLENHPYIKKLTKKFNSTTADDHVVSPSVVSNEIRVLTFIAANTAAGNLHALVQDWQFLIGSVNDAQDVIRNASRIVAACEMMLQAHLFGGLARTINAFTTIRHNFAHNEETWSSSIELAYRVYSTQFGHTHTNTAASEAAATTLSPHNEGDTSTLSSSTSLQNEEEQQLLCSNSNQVMNMQCANVPNAAHLCPQAHNHTSHKCAHQHYNELHQCQYINMNQYAKVPLHNTYNNRIAVAQPQQQNNKDNDGALSASNESMNETVLGVSYAQAIYGEKVLQKVRKVQSALHPQIEQFMLQSYAGVYARFTHLNETSTTHKNKNKNKNHNNDDEGGDANVATTNIVQPLLSLKLRELATVACLAGLNVTPQLISHIRGSLRVGCTREQVRTILDQTELIHGEEAQAEADGVWYTFEKSRAAM